MPVKRDKQYPIGITYCWSQHFYPDLNNNNLSESELDPSPAQTHSHPVLTHISVQFTKLCLKLRRNWSPQQICSHHKIPDIFLQHCHYALDTEPVIFSCHHVIISHHLMTCHHGTAHPHVMRCHHVITRHHLTICHHGMSHHHFMTCRHVITWHHLMTCHHGMTRHRVQTCHNVIICHPIQYSLRTYSSHKLNVPRVFVALAPYCIFVFASGECLRPSISSCSFSCACFSLFL